MKIFLSTFYLISLNFELNVVIYTCTYNAQPKISIKLCGKVQKKAFKQGQFFKKKNVLWYFNYVAYTYYIFLDKSIL